VNEHVRAVLNLPPDALPITTRFVLVVIADHADDQGECWPSARRIANQCGLSNAGTVRKHLDDLQRRGWIDKVRRHRRPDGTLGVYEYRLNIERLFGRPQPVDNQRAGERGGGRDQRAAGSAPARRGARAEAPKETPLRTHPQTGSPVARSESAVDDSTGRRVFIPGTGWTGPSKPSPDALAALAELERMDLETDQGAPRRRRRHP
jgi:hypothetical protein